MSDFNPDIYQATFEFLDEAFRRMGRTEAAMQELVDQAQELDMGY
jgi:hypothetical protein